MAANVALRESKKCRSVEDLLPGIDNWVVLDKIVPQLQWKDFYVLSSVSRAWCDAIRSRDVFDSRVLAHSSETHVPVCYNRDAIALFSMRENSWHKLPPIRDPSGVRHRIPAFGQCISMDGKLYVLGGVMDSQISNKVFEFDLAGQGRWEERASMKQPRLDFGTAVINGKIYVFGGKTVAKVHSSEVSDVRNSKVSDPGLRLTSGSEVYEPKEDTWSPISRMTIFQFGQHVTPVGEELFIYGGFTFGSFPVDSLEAYHPFKDEWRVVQRSWNQPVRGLPFAVQGSFFSIRAEYMPRISLAIHKYDFHGNSWIHVHSFSFAELIPAGYNAIFVEPDAILAVGDELIALVRCERRGDRTCGDFRMCVFQSTGFGSKNQGISWELRATSAQEPIRSINVPHHLIQTQIPRRLMIKSVLISA